MQVSRSLLGASVSRPKAFGIRHRGTCADPACLAVVDTMPETGARLVFFPLFAEGYQVTIDSHGYTGADQQVRATRALNQVGRLPYSQANCDVLATFAETGVASSPQLGNVLLLAGFVGLTIWALRN